MRLNAPTPPVFTVPDTVPVAGVEGIRPTTPIGEGPGGQPSAEGRPAPPPPETPPAEPEIPEADRRARSDRRADDRRRRQIPVLIDTRSGRDRRASARREDDEPPPGSVDIKV